MRLYAPINSKSKFWPFNMITKAYFFENRLLIWDRFEPFCTEKVIATSPLSHITPDNTLRPRQDGRHFPDDIFICIFLNENEWHSIKISLKFVPKVSINNIPALVQIMAWRRPGNKPFSEPMMVVLPTHICVTWPQWVNSICWNRFVVSGG